MSRILVFQREKNEQKQKQKYEGRGGCVNYSVVLIHKTFFHYRALKQNKELKEKLEQIEDRFVKLVRKTTASILIKRVHVSHGNGKVFAGFSSRNEDSFE